MPGNIAPRDIVRCIGTQNHRRGAFASRLCAPACYAEYMTNDELIARAEAVLRPYTTKDGRRFGDVGAALVSGQGHLHTGVAVDTPSWGLCAERAAMAAMITAGEYRVSKIVAVWRDERDGKLYVVPPCGVCRQFMRAVDENNLETEVVLGKQLVEKLKDLLPRYEWPEPL
jgi:cytidine deaminase